MFPQEQETLKELTAVVDYVLQRNKSKTNESAWSQMPHLGLAMQQNCSPEPSNPVTRASKSIYTTYHFYKGWTDKDLKWGIGMGWHGNTGSFLFMQNCWYWESPTLGWESPTLCFLGFAFIVFFRQDPRAIRLRIVGPKTCPSSIATRTKTSGRQNNESASTCCLQLVVPTCCQ